MSNDKKQTAVEWFAKEHKKFREEPWKYVNSGGEDAILQQAKEMETERMIDFVSWIASAEWMSIWVVDKWMWECQKENSNTTYKTHKELLDIHYNETYGGNK